ncbi:hypothetical protein Tco_0169719 [Tanacetum coccineum]
MSDSDESGVTHTEISSTFEELSDIGSPGVVPSPYYIPGPEEPQSPPPLDYVLEPIYPKYMPQEDEVFPAEEQPLPAAQSPDYVPESDLEADLKEDDDENPDEDPVDYPADGDDDENESSEDDEDDDVDIKADEDEEEDEHPTPTDFVVVALPVADQASSAEETKLFETDESATTPPPHPAYRVTARISIPAPVPTPVWSDAEVYRLLAISTPLSSPFSPWSSPLPQIPSPPLPPIPSPSLPVSPPLPQIPSPPLPVSLPVHVLSPSPPASPTFSVEAYKSCDDLLRAEAASTSHSLPLPHPSYTPIPDQMYHHQGHHLCIALGPRYKVGESSSDAAMPDPWTITDSWDEIVEAMYGTPVVTDVAKFSQRMTEFKTRVRRDTDKTQMAELQRQQGPAKGPAQPELPEEAGSSS